ncbi:YDG/SRA domain-containing protein [Aestuariivivens marinum]|uniref:YDG/SRA domain-containing protein n=1 Tax=Aestuariivivens marinum TaxID=2913555 RepID=UPI001F59A734|nr:YDG/SRA domain-containing protein [Aestuariivivens marinum]
MSRLFFGTPEGIKEGQKFPDRKALIAAGLHRSTMHGIDGNGNEGVAAIVLSGGYEDDIDWGDEIIYTGHGGNDPQTGQQIADQSWQDHGNKGLVVSKLRNFPVRVIRGYKHNSQFSPDSGYKYGGLYNVVDHWEEIGKSGFTICRFKLIKADKILDKESDEVKEGVVVLVEPLGKDSKWFSIGVEPPESLQAQRLSSDSTFAKKLIGKKPGEVIDFGNGFKVLEIKRYMSD